MRAVIYARYSSDRQRDASIEDQVRLCRTRIAQEGWVYLHAYTDRALSGASTLRPAYQDLLQDARDGVFDVAVAESLDRFSRDLEHVAAIFKQFSFAGIKLVTLAEGEITELHVGLKGTMNADASIVAVPKQRNSARRTRGRRRQAGRTSRQSGAKRMSRRGGPRSTARAITVTRTMSTWTVGTSWCGANVSDAAEHDSQVLDDILDGDNTALGVWADSAYRSAGSRRR